MYHAQRLLQGNVRVRIAAVHVEGVVEDRPVELAASRICAGRRPVRALVNRCH